MDQERPALRAPGGAVFDLSPLTADIDSAFLASGGLARAADAALAGRLPELPDADSLRVGAPIARPGAVVCIGQNYAEHAAESGSPPPPSPIVFFKHPNTVVGAFDDVLMPSGAVKVDWEVELAVVIGRRADRLATLEDAASCIAGYTVSNDVSERRYQIEESGGQWSKGKCCPTFNPLGPVLVPDFEVSDPQKLELRSWVNGDPRQDSTTADMIFPVDFLVHHLSQYMALDPGDVINTGTPQGVAISGRFPYLRAGDVMELEVSGIGRQRQRLVGR